MILPDKKNSYKTGYYRLQTLNGLVSKKPFSKTLANKKNHFMRKNWMGIRQIPTKSKSKREPV